jgi:Electron transfer DM13
LDAFLAVFSIKYAANPSKYCSGSYGINSMRATVIISNCHLNLNRWRKKSPGGADYENRVCLEHLTSIGDISMTPTRRTTLVSLFGATCALALSACGGGGSDAATPAAAPPAIAPAAPAASAPVAACSPVTNTKVGKTASLSTRSHLVSGQVKIIDSCTIEITNFNYDGLGLSRVFVYGGLAGNYRAGFPIGPNLKGTVYTGQTLRVTLNAGDIDKFDGISIWCADANANFGDATF